MTGAAVTRAEPIRPAAERCTALVAKTQWRQRPAQVMSDYAGEGIGMRWRNVRYSADPGVGWPDYVRSGGSGRGWVDTLATKFPALLADIACGAKRSASLYVVGPAARSRR